MQKRQFWVFVTVLASNFVAASPDPVPINVGACSNIKIATCCAGYIDKRECCDNPGTFGCN
ncbi:hypothetical protein CDEST_15476 [Colletotrichum destructivum]|uniref:Uncharacterized protein n=1 Tax=Colletotrichum destructivum TaxID=34406 RepID=A0AAX4J532_9PEZI|nr:hypothetical protein CDEST_15476 [Colletotrichum destructivum]